MQNAINKHDYAYSVALVRTLETLLLNDNEIERMILAKDAKETFKILNEFDYADNKVGIEDPSQFQKVIDEGLIDIKEILEKIAPDKRTLQMLWLQYDFHNIKTMLKAKLKGVEYTEIENLINKMGAVPVEALKSTIFDENEMAFGLESHTEIYIKKKIKKAQELFEKEKDPQGIDLYLDQKLMKIMFGIAQDSKNCFLKRYVKRLIDLSNIKLFFRMKAQEKEQSLYEIAFLWNGKIPYTKFSDAYKGKLSEFPEAMKNTNYGKIVEEGYKHYENEGTFIFLEKEIENYLTNFIKEAKLIAFGPEALIAYFLAKANNALIIRMVLINKLNEIDPDEIRSRLRNLYS